MHRKVAIVGTSFRFPGSDADSFWPSMLQGRNFVTRADTSRWAHDEFLHPDKGNPGSAYTFAAGTLGDVSLFDAGFFNISPREAASMDPQQRQLLEMTWELFENAGIKPSNMRASDCGVYLGVASVDNGYRLAEDMGAIDAGTATGNTSSIVANRLSFFYDLRGPSMAIDTACSSSLIAFHQACQAIQAGDIDQAIAGGISLHMHPFGFVIFSKASMLSRTGQCHVFDESGDGYVRSEGGGLFLLKDYDKAVADGDRILAVVAGTAANTDGRKSSLTLPSADAQMALMRRAYAKAGIDPEQLDYLEAHGTGTAVGDPIETRAIGEALAQGRSQPLPIGSIKSNMGHLEAASGVAGLMKALYSVVERQVPATIGIQTLNPKIDFEGLNLAVVTQTHPLKPEGELVVGVNSFGFGGANAHVILKSYQPQPAFEAQATAEVPLLLSGKDVDSLAQVADKVAQRLAGDQAPALYDAAYQAMFRRDAHARRLVVLASDSAEVARALADFAADPSLTELASLVETGQAVENAQGPVFVYSGNGSQWQGMGRSMLANPLFLSALAEVDAIFQPLAGYSLRAELAGENGEDRYAATEIAQPALFALQVAITRVLAARGVRPLAVIGHSVGEVAAAWASGALSLEDATQVIYHRSRLQGLTRGNGQMSAVGLSGAATLECLAELKLDDQIVVAGENSHKGATVAGSVAALEVLEAALEQRQVFVRRLALDYAFHSPAMNPIRDQVIEVLSMIRPGATAIPFYSTVTGAELAGERLNAEYWWQNIRHPVLFQPASEALAKAGFNVFVEVGPHPILRSYVSDALNQADKPCAVVPTLLRGDQSPQLLDRTFAKLLIAGADVELTWAFPQPGRFVRLPNYAWQHERYLLPTTAQTLGTLQRERVHPLLGYPLAQHDLVWENRIDTRLHPTLADHKVGEAVLFPGAGFAELALAAAQCFQPGDFVDVEELEIHSPLILSPEHSKQVRVSIDEADGTLSVTSRTLGESEAWAQHVVARLPGEARGVLLDARAPCVPNRPADFDREAHLRLTQAVGLNYGPAYQAVECGWIEGDQILARLSVPAAIETEIGSLHLHPAILDSAFQLIVELLAGKDNASDDLAFVPVKLGRIAFDRTAATPTLALVRLLRQSRHSLLADITLFDEQGRAVVHVQQARLRGVRLQRDRSAHVRQVDSLGIAKPLGHAASVSLGQSMAEPLRERVAGLEGDTLLSRYSDEIDPLLDGLCSAFLREALESLGGELSEVQRAEWALQAPEAALWLERLLALGVADGVLQVLPGGGWRAVAEDEPVSAQAIWQTLFYSYPEQFQIIHSVGRVGFHLLALAKGDISLETLLPRETSPAWLARQVLCASGHQAILSAVRANLAQRLSALGEGQRLRVLEVGMGASPWAVELAPGLDFDRIDYRYCAADLDAAETLKSEFPDVELITFADAEAAPLLASLAFDVVLLSSDLAPLDSISLALRHAALRLRQQGELLLVAQHPARWADFVFAGDARWWLSAEGQPALVAQQRPGFWREELQRHGLQAGEPVELVPGAASGGYLLVGEQAVGRASDATPDTTAEHWTLLVGETGPDAEFAAALAEQLLAAGQQLSWLRPGTQAELAEAMAAQPKPAHVVLVGGLHGQAGLDGQGERCLLAAAVTQACETLGWTPDCWLLTSGAATHLHPQASAAVISTEAAVAAIADAALWGFGRTLANESAACRVRLVDLAPGAGAQALVPALLDRDNENEMAITAQGERFVPRLRVRAEGAGAQVEGRQVTLGFDQPGQLRNLRWEAHQPLVPAADELDIEVKATGLNFRDVMYALGLLSDEAIENGFSGPTMGFEFAGIVKGKGAAVEGEFQAGDRVVGFGPRSFANRLVTQANAVARIPEGMSFEAAATIPSTFFTVYYAVHYLARLEPGEKILIHGAAGGVGIAAIQIARWCGAEIYATAGSDEKRDFLRLLGVQHVLDSRSLAYADEILALTGGRGVDVVLNSLAGEAINRNFRVLRPFGRFLELGKRDFYQNTKIGLRPFRNNISYFGIDADQLMSERPALTRRLFAQMMALFEDGTLHPLPYREFDANDVVEAFRYMQQARQIGKIVVTYRNPIQRVFDSASRAKEALVLDPQASYLVTGGLGGFGLRTAQWLVEKGARHLVLLGRRGAASPEAQPALAAWKAQGIDAQALACDITDAAHLGEVFASLAQSPHPLRGVVHAATVIDDGLIRNIDAAQLQRVLEPKAKGAQHLHELTRALPLDFFVMFSSATTLFGNPGQANYVAANHWLEALARHRRAEGLPATAVLWGAIDDAGFLARNEDIKDALQSRMGGAALQAQVALAQLERLLLEGRSGAGVLELDWKALSRFLPTAQAPRFGELARLGGGDQDDEKDSGDIQRLLAELDDEALRETFAEMLKHEISEILRIPAGKLDAERPLQELGLDSLMSVELVVAVEERFGIRLPVMELSENSSINKLTVRIIGLLRGNQDDTPAADQQQALAQTTLARHGLEASSTELQPDAALTRLID